MNADAPEQACFADATVSLADWPGRCEAEIVAIVAADALVPTQLGDIGLLPGERVRITARGAFGGPLAVRIGSSTFALRREEAACVRVRPLPEHGAPR